MAPFNKILVAIDFSPAAEAALRLASELSRRFEAPLALVYVFEQGDYPLPDGHVVFTSEQFKRMVGQFEQHLAQARRAALDAGARDVTTFILHGWAPNEIIRFAEEGAFDLVVMGTQGRSGLKRLLLGSVAERVVRTASCPVLTVHGPHQV